MARLFWTGNERLRFLRSVGWWLEAAMLQLFWWVVTPLSPHRAAAVGRWLLGRIGPKVAKHRHVLANLSMANPDKSREQIRQLGRQVWENLGAVLAEFPHLGRIIGAGGGNPAVEVVCNNRDADFLAAAKPCIFVAAHLGNWNLSIFGIRSLGYPVDVVYSPLSNPFLDRMVLDKLEVLSSGFITKQNAARPMIKALKSGRSVGLHVDVRVDGGELFPLFGAPATTTTAPAWLSQKTGCAIVPIQTRRLDGDRFRVTVFPALQPVSESLPSEEAIQETTAEMNRAIATLIADNPGQWMCTKRRWPRDVMEERGVY